MTWLQRALSSFGATDLVWFRRWVGGRWVRLVFSDEGISYWTKTDSHFAWPISSFVKDVEVYPRIPRAKLLRR